MDPTTAYVYASHPQNRAFVLVFSAVSLAFSAAGLIALNWPRGRTRKRRKR